MKKWIMIIICLISVLSLYIGGVSMYRLHTISERLSSDMIHSVIDISRGIDIDYIQKKIESNAFDDRTDYSQTDIYLQKLSSELDMYSQMHPKDNLELGNILSDYKILLQKIKYSENPSTGIEFELLKELNQYTYLYYGEEVFGGQIKLSRKYLCNKDKYVKELIQSRNPEYQQLHFNIMSLN